MALGVLACTSIITPQAQPQTRPPTSPQAVKANVARRQLPHATHTCNGIPPPACSWTCSWAEELSKDGLPLARSGKALGARYLVARTRTREGVGTCEALPQWYVRSGQTGHLGTGRGRACDGPCARPLHALKHDLQGQPDGGEGLVHADGLVVVVTARAGMGRGHA